MCSLTLALTGLTTGLSMAGQYQQSRAQAAAYQAQADAAYQNARIQNKQSEQIAENAAKEQRKLDARMRLIAGQNNAQAGASGIMGNVGSPLDIYNASIEAWGEDTQDALWNQRNNTYNSMVKEVNFRNQGNAYSAQAKAAKQAGNIGMIGTLLSGAASMYGMKTNSASVNNGPYFASPSTGFLTGSSAIQATQASANGIFGNAIKLNSRMPGWVGSRNYYGG